MSPDTRLQLVAEVGAAGLADCRLTDMRIHKHPNTRRPPL